MEVYPLLFQKRHLCLPFYATLSSLSDFYKLWPFIARAKMQFWSFFEFPFFSYLFKRPFIKILDRINQLQKVFIRRMNQFLLWWAWKSSFLLFLQVRFEMRTWKDRKARILLKVPTKITTSLLLLSSSNTTCDFEWMVWYFPKKVFDTFLFLLSSSSFGHFLIEFSTELEKIAPSIHDTFFQWIWALSLSNNTLIQNLKNSHGLKITQNVAFEFLNFGIFHQFLSY